MRITSKLSKTQFVLENHFKPGRTYKRNISNLRRWVGPIPDADSRVAQEATDEGMADIEVGDFVMARDNVPTTKVDSAEVAAITDQGIELLCYGTRNGQPSAALSSTRCLPRGRMSI